MAYRRFGPLAYRRRDIPCSLPHPVRLAGYRAQTICRDAPAKLLRTRTRLRGGYAGKEYIRRLLSLMVAINRCENGVGRVVPVTSAEI